MTTYTTPIFFFGYSKRYFQNADPLQGLTASECLEYLPAVVSLCPLDSPREALTVFKWAATAILGVVNEAWLSGCAPFDDGGLV